MRLTIIVPVHNEESIVEPTLKRLRECPLLNAFSETNVILVENGSVDNSRQVVSSIEEWRIWPETKGWLIGTSVSNAGIGYAYARGAELAIEKGMTGRDDWLLWTACDLPFGFSDLDSFLELLSQHCESPIIIGSKAHPNSVVPRGITRKLMTLVFRFLRRLVLGMSVGDTQGTFFVRGDILKPLLESTETYNFFFTTEFCYHAVSEHLPIVEVPVRLEPQLRPSTVRPVRDGWRMMRGLLRTARRVRR